RWYALKAVRNSRVMTVTGHWARLCVGEATARRDTWTPMMMAAKTTLRAIPTGAIRRSVESAMVSNWRTLAGHWTTHVDSGPPPWRRGTANSQGAQKTVRVRAHPAISRRSNVDVKRPRGNARHT